MDLSYFPLIQIWYKIILLWETKHKIRFMHGHYKNACLSRYPPLGPFQAPNNKLSPIKQVLHGRKAYWDQAINFNPPDANAR